MLPQCFSEVCFPLPIFCRCYNGKVSYQVAKLPMDNLNSCFSNQVSKASCNFILTFVFVKLSWNGRCKYCNIADLYCLSKVMQYSIPCIVSSVTLIETKRIWKLHSSINMRSIWHVPNTTFSLQETTKISLKSPRIVTHCNQGRVSVTGFLVTIRVTYVTVVTLCGEYGAPL